VQHHNNISIHPSTTIIVVIPCYNEPNLVKSLQSLYDCEPTQTNVEVITVINSSEADSKEVLEQNQYSLNEALAWSSTHQRDKIHFSFIEATGLPKKDAGVGLARKIGMDEAYNRLASIDNKDGIIVCFDADATCAKNYLSAIESHFNQHPKSVGCSIYYEHPIDGNEFPQQIYDGIIQYELHLRYYKEALHYIGLPYAFHTVGSSMVVRAAIYHKQGGMNKRKAGEDFYFLQKVIPLGNFTEINTTTVFPSPRISERVPFGTGRAMQQWTNNNDEILFTYNFNSFKELKIFFDTSELLFFDDEIPLPKSVLAFLKENDFESNLKKIRANATNSKHFKELLFKWFNAFKTLKFLHFCRDNFHQNQPINEAANVLLRTINLEEQQSMKVLLLKYRNLQITK
jgi:glycosyltransferase involved in cell wall biosynthesis